MARLSLILVAAGEGRRIGGTVRKALIPIGGEPLLLHALRALEGIPHRTETIVVVHPEDMEGVRNEWGIEHLVPGGAERRDSVRAGLEATAPDSDLVAVHDAARPFVHRRDLEAVVEAALAEGAAILASRVRDTVKVQGEGRAIERTLSRKGLWLAETPQVFRRDLLLDAHDRVDGPVTDDAEMVERCGGKVVLVPSTSPNWKITTRADVERARNLLGRSPGS